MLIPLPLIMNKLKLNITGIFHIGAHECEELNDYIKYVNPDNIYWVEAQKEKVNLMKSRNISNIYDAIIDDVDDKDVILNISNNGQSSSILDFGTHLHHHPHVQYIDKIQGKTKRLDTLIEENSIPIDRLNFMNIDIQGVELRALRSMEKYLKHVNYIYTEVNEDYVYKDCNLVGEIDEYLANYGFKRVVTKMVGNTGWGDALYIK
jgi:FkbM family methyltransferase